MAETSSGSGRKKAKVGGSLDSSSSVNLMVLHDSSQNFSQPSQTRDPIIVQSFKSTEEWNHAQLLGMHTDAAPTRGVCILSNE